MSGPVIIPQFRYFECAQKSGSPSAPVLKKCGQVQNITQKYERTPKKKNTRQVYNLLPLER